MKIFVSSTYLDLKDYRIKARKVIEESKNEFIGMEIFQSHTHEPSEFCAENVEECDAFVLIVAYRYGFIPESQTISITQLEYEHALRKKIPVRIYLMDDNHPWPSSPECRDKKSESIDVFRNLLQNHTCSFYSTPEAFYDKLKLDIQKFPVPPAYYPVYPMLENFTSRKQEREMFTNWLRKDSHPVLALIAMGGMGKTALTWYWLTEDIKGSDEQPRKILWWSFYDSEAEFDRFLRKAIEYFNDDEVEWNKLASTRDKMEFLYEILSKNRYLMILDGVERVLRNYFNLGSPYQGDEIIEDANGDFRSCIEPNCSMFLQWLTSGDTKTKTLFTSRLYPKELDDLEGCLRKNLKQMDKEDAVEFFHRQSVKGTRSEIETACESVGYHPLYLRLLSGMIICDPKNPGDIQEWMKYDLIPELKGKEGHNIFEFAYNSLDKKKQEFISKLSAFRNPMDYDAIVNFNEFGDEGKLKKVLIELVDRGMLLRDNNKFDMHPVVRKYCYDRLTDREGVHSRLREYFSAIPVLEKIESVDDLAPVIELYQHTVGAGRYDEAAKLFRDRLLSKDQVKLHDQLYYKFGTYHIIIELLRGLLPDGEDKLPRLKDKSYQEWIISALANSYSLSGQPRLAASLFDTSIKLAEKADDKINLITDLENLALMAQIPMGELNAGEIALKRSIEISRKVNDKFSEAIEHQELGRLFAYRGNYNECEKELAKALELFTELDKVQSQCIVWVYKSLHNLLIPNAEEALKSAKKAGELANIEKREADIIWVEYLLGAAHLMNGNIAETENHLTEAIIRDRKINLIEFEPDILLEFAKLRFKQNRKPEALKSALEALQISNRCEYRLTQADIHNFLAEFYLDAGDFVKARQHGESAKERAGCGYVPAMEKAEKLLKEIKSR
jgi:tetratricopeptide (TPR) repeat protein